MFLTVYVIWHFLQKHFHVNTLLLYLHIHVDKQMYHVHDICPDASWPCGNHQGFIWVLVMLLIWTGGVCPEASKVSSIYTNVYPMYISLLVCCSFWHVVIHTGKRQLVLQIWMCYYLYVTWTNVKFVSNKQTFHFKSVVPIKSAVNEKKY